MPAGPHPFDGPAAGPGIPPPLPRGAQPTDDRPRRRRRPCPGLRPAAAAGPARAAPDGAAPVAAWLHPRRTIQARLLLAAPLGWLLIAYLGALFILLLNAFWDKDAFTGQVIPFSWSLEAFQDIASEPVYRTIALRTIGMAALVTVTDALLAFPIAYYMARIASPRKRGLLVIAVLMPLWAAYLVKVYAWRTILQGNGFVDWLLTPLGIPAPGLTELCELVARVLVPVAAVHDPADLRGPRADPGLAARGVRRPRRPGLARRSGGSSCRSSFPRSSRARSSRSR